MKANKRSQEPSWQEDLPSELQNIFYSYTWKDISIGRSGMHVFAVDGGYMKIAQQGNFIRNQLLAEKERLDWLQNRLPVPQVYFYGQTPHHEYLYLSAIPGIMACEALFADKLPRLISLIAEALHIVHALPSESCPFILDLPQRFSAIRKSIANKQFNKNQFMARHKGLTPEEWYEQMEEMRPKTENLVFTHGDFSFPNVLIDPQKMEINGFIDWGRGGIADYHQDLADASWSLGYNFSPDWIPVLQDAYGRDLIDRDKLAFYSQLDDLRSYMEEMPS